MTVALGMTAMGSIFVCADSHVVSTDGTVTSGCKLSGKQCGNGSFAIANASDDANAASMVAKEILDELSKSTTDKWNIEPAIKNVMQSWQSGYGQVAAPSMQLVLAASVSKQNRGLYFCSPPNTVLRKDFDESVVIGCGGQVLDALLPEVVRGPLRLREALIRAAYLMYRVKKEHVFLKGSDTDVLVIGEENGDIRFTERTEMAQAEELGPDMDFMLRYCYLMLGFVQGQEPLNLWQGFKRKYKEVRKKADAITFPSLDGMVGT